MTAVATPDLLRPADGPAPEAEIVRDLLRRALLVVPAFVLGGLVFGGTDGALSAAVGAGLVMVNFIAAATTLAWAARINLAVLMGVSLFGYLVRVGVLFGAVLLLRELSWVHVASLGVTLVAMHLGLLVWELRFVSASLAHPGLKPVGAGSTTANKEHNR